MKIYTGKGDNGHAGLLSGERVPKSHERIMALGDIDELSSALGVLRAGLTKETIEAGKHILNSLGEADKKPAILSKVGKSLLAQSLSPSVK